MGLEYVGGTPIIFDDMLYNMSTGITNYTSMADMLGSIPSYVWDIPYEFLGLSAYDNNADNVSFYDQDAGIPYEPSSQFKYCWANRGSTDAAVKGLYSKAVLTNPPTVILRGAQFNAPADNVWPYADSASFGGEWSCMSSAAVYGNIAVDSETGTLYPLATTIIQGSPNINSLVYPFCGVALTVLPESCLDGGVLNTANTNAYTVSFGFGYDHYANVWKINRSKQTFVPVADYVKALDGQSVDKEPPYSEADPFDQGGISGIGIGGGGTFNRKSDSIGWAVTPSISPADTGLVTLYVGTASDMKGLADFLWSGLFDVDTFKKLFTSPMDCVIGASMLPVTPPNNPSSTIIFGNIDTEVPMAHATTTYVRVDCGSISLTEYWQAYLDYAPYTKVHIYLPFIGFKELNTDEVMGKTIAVKYLIECLSGTFCVQVGVDGGAKILAQYAGSCAIQVPLTANNWGQAIGSVIQVAGQAIGGFASGGAAGALMAGGLGAASSAISGGFKPEIQRNGSVTGAGGWMASMTPYIIIEWPRQSKPMNLNKFEGYPSNDTMLLGTCVGYTKVEEINLDGVPATSPELDEIESLLKGGVLF